MKSTDTALVVAHLDRHLSSFAELANQAPLIAAMGDHISTALERHHKVLICGNGGSAADSQHFAAELVGRFVAERRALPAIALSTDSSALTSISNDYGFGLVYERQVEALGQAGDVLVAISTSGNSPNVIAAARTARARGMTVVGFTGTTEGELHSLSDLCLAVPSRETARIQEAHIFAIHCVCAIIDQRFTSP